MKNSKQGGSFAVIAGLMAVLVILLGILAANVFELKKFADSGTAQKTTIGGSGVEFYLPDTYYAASGLTMEIYNSQITNQGTHITEYNVVWECEVGEMLERKFSIDLYISKISSGRRFAKGRCGRITCKVRL